MRTLCANRSLSKSIALKRLLEIVELIIRVIDIPNRHSRRKWAVTMPCYIRTSYITSLDFFTYTCFSATARKRFVKLY